MKRQNQKGMILAIDMGNTNIVIGCVDDEKIYFEERLCTDYSKTELEYAIGFKTVLELYNIESEQIHGAIISSVVPQLVNVIKSAVEKIIGITPLIVGPGVKTGLNLLMDQPKQVGTDMVVDAVAAIHEYGAPVLIIDVGTATTISAVDDNASCIDGMVDRIREELCKMTGAEQEQVKVIATGGLARVIVPYCNNEIILDDKLLLKGLKIIYDKNVE